VSFLRRLAFAPIVLLVVGAVTYGVCALGLWATVLLIAMGLFADGIVARFDPRVRTSPARAW
jgi:hypothetical protein